MLNTKSMLLGKIEEKKNSSKTCHYYGFNDCNMAYRCVNINPKVRRSRDQHSMAFQIPSASKATYKNSFIPRTIRDWNDLPDSLISSAQMSDDCVSKSPSLVRARD